ncbi:hypothetical protein Hanom_Chr04g00368171 [Helianthus anomalus]
MITPTPQAKTSNSDIETHIIVSYVKILEANSSKEAVYNSIRPDTTSSSSSSPSNSDTGSERSSSFEDRSLCIESIWPKNILQAKNSPNTKSIHRYIDFYNSILYFYNNNS